MKRWSRQLVVAVFFVGVLTAIFILNEKEIDPSERWKVRQQERTNQNRIIHCGTLEIELLSCEVLHETDLSRQERYQGENFFLGELPSTDYTIRYMDEAKVKAECPALKELWENEGKYSQEEYEKITNENQEIIRKHIYTRHPDSSYAFIQCKITSTGPGDNFISPCIYARSADGKLTSYDIDALCYFDKAIHTEGNDRTYFYVYNFAPGETLECTLGFVLQEDFNLGEGQTYYVGSEPLKLPVEDPEYNKNAVKIDRIGK